METMKNTEKSLADWKRVAYFHLENEKETNQEEPTAVVWVWLLAEKDDCRQIRCSPPA
jgi:hypothetical protein